MAKDDRSYRRAWMREFRTMSAERRAASIEAFETIHEMLSLAESGQGGAMTLSMIENEMLPIAGGVTIETGEQEAVGA